jgi:hypothetical protein
MPSIDFTLDDIRKVVREETNQAFKEQFQPAFDKAFKPAFDEAFEPHALAIQQDFMTINERLDKLETGLETVAAGVLDLKADLKGVKRIVGQHSKDKVELRSRIA